MDETITAEDAPVPIAAETASPVNTRIGDA